MDRDEYHESGEFLDLFSQDAWRALADPVRAALAGAAPVDGPLVDLGAGSGLGIRVIAGAVPDAHILAVEPSAMQRAALFARIGPDPDLRERVTVLATDAQHAPLPDRIGGAIAMNMIGHLDPDARRALWRRLGDRLAPDAPLVVNLQPPSEPVVLPETDFISVRVGRHVYLGSGAAEPDGTQAVAWRMRYRVLDGSGRDADEADRVVREITAEYRWHVLSPATLLSELRAAGFVAALGPLDMVRAVVRRKPVP